MDPSSQFLARQALQTIVNAFKDPHHPSYCEIVLLGCFATLKNYACTPLHYPYFDACMLFLTAPRPWNEVEDLKRALTCRCRYDARLNTIFIRAMHARAAKQGIVPGATPPAFEVLMCALFTTIETALECAFAHGGSLYKVERRHKRVKDTEGVVPWPIQPTQLTPFGPEDSIRGLIRWCQTEDYLDASMLDVARLIVHGCNRQVIPYVVTSQTLLETIADHVEGGYAAWNDPQNDQQFHDHPGAMKRLKRSADLICNILEHTDPVERATFAKGSSHGRATLNFCNGALYWASSLTLLLSPLSSEDNFDLNFVRYTFLELGGIVYASFETAAERPMSCREEIIVRSKELKTAKEDPWLSAFLALKELTSSERCAAPGCAKTFADIGAKFKHCSRCRRAPYCSIQCQKDAWTHPVAPHKQVCRMIQELGMWGGLGRKVVADDLDDFMSARPVADARMNVCAMAIKSHWELLGDERMKSIGEKRFSSWYDVLLIVTTVYKTENQWENALDPNLRGSKQYQG